jgi:pilus assembly protein FimV
MGRELEPTNTLFQAPAGTSLAADQAPQAAWTDSPGALDTEDTPPASVLPQIPAELDLDLDFLDRDIAPPAAAQGAPGDASLTVPAPLELPHTEPESQFDGLDFDLDLNDITSPLADTPPPAASPLADGTLPELELPAAAEEPATASADDSDAADPLATKLSLAEEFSSIGDEDGARALAEEVLAEATGALRAKAQAFLATLA